MLYNMYLLQRIINIDVLSDDTLKKPVLVYDTGL